MNTNKCIEKCKNGGDRIKLIDMDKDKWRDARTKGELGSKWRSKQVYRCKICHTKTNKWVWVGRAMGPRIFCPAAKLDEHKELKKTLGRHKELSERIQELEEITQEGEEIDSDEAKETIKNLRSERELLEEKINKLRENFGEEFNDVKGTTIQGKDFRELGHIGKLPSLRDVLCSG